MSIQEKGKKFVNILKKYGITEYWCDEDFDINEEHPFATVVVPKHDWSLTLEIQELYNDYSDDNSSLLRVMGIDKANLSFSQVVKNLQRRAVV